MMETTKGNDAAKGAFARENRTNTLLGIIGWTLIILGAVLILWGLWRDLRAPESALTAEYSDGRVYAQASYGKEAQIPADAEFRAVPVTADTDPEGYAQKMEDAKAAMGTDAAKVLLYHVGFYVGDQEIEPAAPVSVVLRVGQDGFAAGEAIQVIHFGEDETEVIADAQVDETGCVTFTTDGFSDFAILRNSAGETVFGFVFNDPGQTAGVDLTGDMTGLVSDVSIENQRGETVTDGKLFVGEKYTIHLKFTEGGMDGKQFAWDENGIMTYQIPKSFRVEPRSNVDLVIDGVVIGKYSVDENGRLTIELNADGQQRLYNSNNYTLSFDMEATAQKTEGGNDEDVHFGDTGEDFHFVVTDQPQISVDKISLYDSDTHTLNYTVSTKIDHGPVQDVVVTDTLTPPNSKGITLAIINGEDGKPDIKVTVIRNGETIELTEEDYELVPAEPDPAYPGKEVFQVKIKEGSAYDPLETGDELQVAYQYKAEFDTSAADVYWGQVVNEATVTGAMPMKDPASQEEKKVPVEETRGSYAEVYWDTDGNGVVSKDEAYSEATGKLHYTLYAAAKAGDYTPFFITDQATVEYNGRTWIVQGFDTEHISNLEVYAQDIADWSTKGLPAGTGEKQKLTGYNYRGDTTGYSPERMDNYIYAYSEKSEDDPSSAAATDLYIFFGMDAANDQGHWDYDKDRLMTVEYDLDVSNGLTLYDKNTGETIALTKEQILLAGITNTVHLRYGPFFPGYSVFFSNGEKLNKYGRLDKLNNTIGYTVSLNLQDTTVWDYLKDVASDTPDAQTTDGKIMSAVFFDDYADGWEYVDGSLKATLYPKSEAPYVYTYDPNGPTSWVSMSGDDFSDGDIRAYLWDFVNGYGSYLPAAFTADYGSKVDRLEFTYTLKASEAWLKEHANSASDTNVHNAAQILDDTMSHWDAEANVLYFPNRLSKTAQQDGTSNLITFTLDINSVGADLDPEKDYLIVTDDSTGIQIVPGSIKVTDGSGKELTGIGDTTLDAPLNDDQWGLLPAEGEHRYKLKIPDGAALRITYDALVTEMGDSVAVSNRASIDGVDRADSSYEGSLKVDEIHASGGGDEYQLTIVKVDGDNNSKKLPDATFELYAVKPEGSTQSSEQYKEEITIGEMTYQCQFKQELTTGPDGSVDVDSKNLEPGRYYILKETEAPKGYALLKEPVLFYFGLKNDDVDPTVAIAPPDGMLTVADPPTQYTLPESGGPGTGLYLWAGLALALGSAVALGAKKRRRAQ